MTDRSRFDLLIIGAGINGAGLARDAAGRGLKVCLVDSGDLGSATSSASSKLIHGGLRYLEFYEFALVKKALAERETILSIAPHLARPMPFIIPVSRSSRPRLILKAALFAYDRLAKTPSFPDHSQVKLRDDVGGHGLKDSYKNGFRFWDGWVDDSRLVVANCQDAARSGAEIITYDAVKSGFASEDGWLAVLESGRELYASQIVNCTGPWAEVVARSVLNLPDAPTLSLVQGAHIVVPRVGRQSDAYMLQQPDGRIVFVIPYQKKFSLIGTTETPVPRPGAVEITDEEIDYLIAAVNPYIAHPIDRGDIVASFAGIRPLVFESEKDARETTRDWRLHAHPDARAMTVIGGKLTTYRLLAEAIMQELYPETEPWTAQSPLPGGDVPRRAGRTPREDFEIWLTELTLAYPNHDPVIIERLAGLYGTRAADMLAEGLGENHAGLFAAEIDYLMDEEWAKTPRDILWRRTKHSLDAGPSAEREIEAYMTSRYTKA